MTSGCGGGGGGGGGRVEVIENKGCSRLINSSTSSSTLGSLIKFTTTHNNPINIMSPSPTSVGSQSISVTPLGPFSGLVICVTGLSKDARKQVMEATERLGGLYSPNLNPQCTHLVVQTFGGHKLQHAFKIGSRKNTLFVVTLGWLVDSVTRNVRLSESLYNIKSVGDNGVRLDELNRLVGFSSAENSCLPAGILEAHKLNMRFSGKDSNKTTDTDSVFMGHTMYVDSDISAELYKKGQKKGLSFSIGGLSGAERAMLCVKEVQPISILPQWVLKTAKDNNVRRLTHMSADLARQVGTSLENSQNRNTGEDHCGGNILQATQSVKDKLNIDERQHISISAKLGVRNRRGHHMQTCQITTRTITPSRLLDSICWSISEPTSMASIYIDSISADGKDSEASFADLTHPLKESEKSERIFKSHFLTILFPIDRYSEMGPSSRTFFSNNGFTCLQVLDHIYAFYQENLSTHEIEVAIHSDSRHADRLRSVYCSKETAEHCNIIFKRIEFLGSRKSFEMLKRVSGDNSSNVYELSISA
ncbi:hypothetical protein ACFE04_017156 [Oxalis oulophora]